MDKIKLELEAYLKTLKDLGFYNTFTIVDFEYMKLTVFPRFSNPIKDRTPFLTEEPLKPESIKKAINALKEYISKRV